MPDFEKGDRVKVDTPSRPVLKGTKGTVQWVQSTHKDSAYRVRLDGETAARTYFRHDLESVEGNS